MLRRQNPVDLHVGLPIRKIRVLYLQHVQYLLSNMVEVSWFGDAWVLVLLISLSVMVHWTLPSIVPFSKLTCSLLHLHYSVEIKTGCFNKILPPCHTSRASRTWLQEHSIQVLEWPAQSPDMSPIENLWWIIKRSVSKSKPKNLEELKAVIQEEWGGTLWCLCDADVRETVRDPKWQLAARRPQQTFHFQNFHRHFSAVNPPLFAYHLYHLNRITKQTWIILRITSTTTTMDSAPWGNPKSAFATRIHLPHLPPLLPRHRRNHPVAAAIPRYTTC